MVKTSRNALKLSQLTMIGFLVGSDRKQIQGDDHWDNSETDRAHSDRLLKRFWSQ
jgi:hypothetical protein